MQIAVYPLLDGSPYCTVNNVCSKSGKFQKKKIMILPLVPLSVKSIKKAMAFESIMCIPLVPLLQNQNKLTFIDFALKIQKHTVSASK